MGYHLTTSLALPSARSLASPKTHVPGSRLQERGHRYYSASLSRWVSRDPIGENGGINLYVICGNDNANCVDLFGASPTTSRNVVRVYTGNPLVEITSETQIPIEYVEGDGGGFGHGLPLVDPEPLSAGRTKVCSAQIAVFIKINNSAPEDWRRVPSSVKQFGYFLHTKANDHKALVNAHGASGEVVRNGTPRSVLESHERAHAKVFFQYVAQTKESLDQLGYILPHGINAHTFVWGFLAKDPYQIASAKAANAATIGAFASNGNLVQEWPGAPTSSSVGETSRIGTIDYHYIWKLRTQ
jgi:RHS repeat-associated protein